MGSYKLEWYYFCVVWLLGYNLQPLLELLPLPCILCSWGTSWWRAQRAWRRRRSMKSLKDYQGNVISAAEAMALIERLPSPKKTEPKNPEPPSRISFSEGDFLTLENISCVDADGNVFESYDRLDVARDIFRADGKQINRTPYNHAVHCESNGLFLPSFALTCNIVARLYEGKSDAHAEKVLQQYKDRGDRFSYHAQNTIIAFGSSEIIHYPSASDFSQAAAVNASQRHVVLPFVKDSLEDALLKDALHDASTRRYVQQLTGLHEPEILIEIGKYFGKPAKVWFPWNGKAGKGFKEKRAAWFGCNDALFNLFANYSLYGAYTARGVRRGGERSEPGAGGAV